MGISQSNDVTSGISTSSSPVLLPSPAHAGNGLPLVSCTSSLQPLLQDAAHLLLVAFLLVVQLCVWLHENTSCLNESSTPIDPDGIVLETCPL